MEDKEDERELTFWEVSERSNERSIIDNGSMVMGNFIEPDPTKAS